MSKETLKWCKSKRSLGNVSENIENELFIKININFLRRYVHVKSKLIL